MPRVAFFALSAKGGPALRVIVCWEESSQTSPAGELNLTSYLSERPDRERMAGTTRLELATSAVTGRRCYVIDWYHKGPHVTSYRPLIVPRLNQLIFFAPRTLKFCEFCTTLHLTRRSIVLDCDSVLPLRRYRAPISSRVCPPVQSYRAPGSKEAGHARCGAGYPDALNAARKQARAPERRPERAVQHSRQ